MADAGGARSREEPRNPDYALFFTAQVIANSGFWFQNLALTLVVLDVTGSAQALGLVTAVQLAPILVLSVLAGRIADRVRARSILLVTSAGSALVVLGLAVVVAAPDPSLVWLLVLVAALGSFHAFERIASQAIVFELVGAKRVAKGAAFATTALSAARSIGPGLAGVAFQSFGAVVCMLVDAAALLVVFVCLLCIRTARLHSRGGGARSGPRERFAWTRDIVTILVVNSVLAFFVFNLMLTLTSAVTITFEADAAMVGFVHALNAIGGVAGGIVAARREGIVVRGLVLACLLVAGSFLATSLSPSLLVFMLLGPALGFAIGYYQASLYAVANRGVASEQIGRMMSFVTLGHYGIMPFGALFAGWVVDASDARVMLGLGAAAALASAVFVVSRARRSRRDGE